jgi:predicted nucleic acid-binding protein
MIVFFDTSALLKRYINEAHSDAVLSLSLQTQTLAVSQLTWVEAHAAFARREREVPQDRPSLLLAKQHFKHDWSQFLLIQPLQSVLDLAADYADTFALRAYDSVQLASAKTLLTATTGPVTFACFDARLNKAAAVLGLQGMDGRLATAA